MTAQYFFALLVLRKHPRTWRLNQGPGPHFPQGVPSELGALGSSTVPSYLTGYGVAYKHAEGPQGRLVGWTLERRQQREKGC